MKILIEVQDGLPVTTLFNDDGTVDQVLFKGVVWVFENVLERFFELSPIQS